jgi:hypothetical protein
MKYTSAFRSPIITQDSATKNNYLFFLPSDHKSLGFIPPEKTWETCLRQNESNEVN